MDRHILFLLLTRIKSNRIKISIHVLSENGRYFFWRRFHRPKSNYIFYYFSNGIRVKAHPYSQIKAIPLFIFIDLIINQNNNYKTVEQRIKLIFFIRKVQ